jgi:opacity protein-like surface antigen
MKKTFLLIAALLMLGSAAFADGGSGINLGIKAGFQTAKLSYEKANIKSDFANHFTVGLFGRVSSGRLYVQPEVLYFKTSNVFSATVTPEDNGNLIEDAHVNLTLNQMNLQVPVMIGIKVIDLDLITLRAQAGPTANFVLKSQTLFDKTYSLNGDQPEEDTNTDEEFDPKSIAWGVQAGIGVDVMKRFTLDINYSFGLSKMFDTLENTTIGEYFNTDNVNIDNTRQNLFMVTLGFMF